MMRPFFEPLEDRVLFALTPISDPAPLAAATLPARQAEALNRGLVAVRRNSTSAYLSWRLLGTDPSAVAFNVYRSANSAAPLKLNTSPLTATTDYTDTTLNTAVSNRYFVRPVINGIEQPDSDSFTLPANSAVRQFLPIPLQIPAGGTTPTGEAYTYSANDTSVGDLDGDGDYEFVVKWDPSNAKDNSQSGYTGNVYLDAYTLEGTRLWRIDLGRNIRAGAHYTQFIVYDLDGDGRAEVATKTAPGTVDGAGNNVLLGADNPAADYRNASGYVLSGPEYLTVFNGLTGANMATTPFLVARGSVSNWGDSYGNRVDRFLAGVAYLDGQRPSLVFGRGYYERTTLSAWDWRGGQFTNRWVFDSEDATPDPAYEGQGTHSLSVADADGDGRDEIIYGAATFDDNGQPLATSGLGHGDALHVSDMDPSRPGLEVFQVHEGTGGNGHVGGSLRDAATGQVLVALPVAQNTDGSWPDVGRGVAMDVDPSPGYEFWTISHPSIYAVDGTPLYGRGNAFINFGAWWDADLYRELLDGTTIANWTLPGGGRSNFDLDPATSGTQGFAPGTSSNNGTKSTPALSGDILGDWREEVVWRSSDNTELRIFTTTIPAANRLVTLMHDIQYREAIAWQNTAYNQPPHPSFFLGNGMTAPPPPNIYLAGAAPPSGTYPAELGILGGTGTVTETTNAGYNGTAYVNFPATGGSLTFAAVEAGAGGLADLTIRYALGVTTSRTGVLTVNGASQPVTFEPTGAWTNWTTITVPVTLAAGTANAIRFESTGQDLANIDEITLPPTTSATYTGTPADDAYTLRRNPAGDIELLIHGALAHSIPATVPSLSINLLGGNDSLTIDLSGGSPLPGGGITFDGGAGADALAVVGSPGADAVSVDPAAVRFGAPAAVTHANLESTSLEGTAGWDAVTVSAGASLLLRGTIYLDSLTLAPGSTAALAAGSNSVLVTRALTLPANATLDLHDNDLVLDYTGPSRLAAVTALVAAAAGPDLLWLSPGLTSSTARARATHQSPGPATALAVSESAVYKSRTGWNTFADIPVDDSAVLVKYTYAADATLDGRVTDKDADVLYAHYQDSKRPHLYTPFITTRAFTDADLTFDGLTDDRDLDLLASTISPLAPVP